MSQDTIAIPQAAVAAAGRALQFTIAELSMSLKIMDQSNPSKALLENGILEMMDANKALFSAIPFCPDVIPALQHQLKVAQSTTEDLKARLILRTEQSMATAYRDAETIRELTQALQALHNLYVCADETGYVEDVGFMDVDAITSNALAAIAKTGLSLAPSAGQSPRGA